MNTTSTEAAARRPASRIAFSPASTVLLAISFGLCGGYLDSVIILFSKWFWNRDQYLRIARDFPWTVPIGHVVLLVIPAIVIIALNFRPPRGQRLTAPPGRGC